jgi:hypothetical protein
MQQATSRQLYEYWNVTRNGRAAPHRLEIEPAKIASLLPEVFIAECDGLFTYRFRLAGTKICEQFGRELRGCDFLTLWDIEDRNALAAMLRKVSREGAVGHVLCAGQADANRQAKFELVVMPLAHDGEVVTRLLGAMTAIEPPAWLGSAPLQRQRLLEVQLLWPDEAPSRSPALTRIGHPPSSVTGPAATPRDAAMSSTAGRAK